jgi:hypothetical protein
VCHALLRDASLYDQLLTFDHDLAAAAHWWRETFVASVFWRGALGLMPPHDIHYGAPPIA